MQEVIKSSNDKKKKKTVAFKVKTRQENGYVTTMSIYTFPPALDP